jgi:hypothetical protein
MSDEIERIRRDHIADPDGDPNDPHCVMCSDASYPIWPCDAAILLALLAERDAEVARLVDLADDLLSHPTPADDHAGCWFCGGGLGNGPTGHKDACAWRRLRAALAARGGEGAE